MGGVLFGGCGVDGLGCRTGKSDVRLGVVLPATAVRETAFNMCSTCAGLANRGSTARPNLINVLKVGSEDGMLFLCVLLCLIFTSCPKGVSVDPLGAHSFLRKHSESRLLLSDLGAVHMYLVPGACVPRAMHTCIMCFDNPAH